MNDGDSVSPWSELSHISDPRLIRFDLSANRGPYFATAVVLNACRSPYLMIQDADDWSVPDRLGRLLNGARRKSCDFMGSSLANFTESTNGVPKFSYYARFPNHTGANDSRLFWRFSHHGLWKTSSLRSLGGYYGGFRVSYDLFLTNMIRILGKVECIDLPLYYRVSRAHSLTVQPKTALRSPYRAAVERLLGKMYREILTCRHAFLRREISAAQLLNCAARITQKHVTPDQSATLHYESDRLRAVLS
jgi:glycosyltransferase involved in cell wall biosynthesis